MLWDERDESTRARVDQVWFAGVHSNVGGGYPQQGMSLVALDWMMVQAERCGLRLVPHLGDQYATQHSFADKLYDSRSGLGIFYRWRPRDVKAICAARGIPVPRVHVSAIERITQAPEGYAPGNLSPSIQVVATEASPQVRLFEVADAVASAYGSGEATPLVTRMAPWVVVGDVAYFAFLAGVLGALVRTAAAVFTPAPHTWSDVGQMLSRMLTGFPFGLVAAVWNDSAALGLLAGGLVVGYALSTVSARRLDRTYSTFWHLNRPTLRKALRRTPPPSRPVVAARSGPLAGAERVSDVATT